MQNIPAPTTSIVTRANGESTHISEWTIGAYTLRKATGTDGTRWTATTDSHHLPRIADNAGFDRTPDFGVSCPSKSGLIPAGAAIYAAQIMEAAQSALTFNEIIAANK